MRKKHREWIRESNIYEYIMRIDYNVERDLVPGQKNTITHPGKKRAVHQVQTPNERERECADKAQHNRDENLNGDVILDRAD